jgi:hypothetical protein
MAETKIESVGKTRIYGETRMWVAGKSGRRLLKPS